MQEAFLNLGHRISQGVSFLVKIKFDMDIMKQMSLFESLTRTSLKDCFVDANSLLTFIVGENQISRAIGKKGSNVRRLQQVLNRKIKIVEFNPDVVQFVRNYIYPLKAKDITLEDKVLTIVPEDTQTRGALIGRNASNLRNLEGSVKRHFDIQEIKVV